MPRNYRPWTPTISEEVADQIGERPERYLDRPISEIRERNSMPRARIRGIDKLEVAHVWRAVERQLDRGPRPQVIEWIEDRIDYLEEHGERPPLGPDRDDWVPPDPPDTDHPSTSERFSAQFGSGGSSTRRQTTTTDESTETELGEFAVATDGGESGD